MNKNKKLDANEFETAVSTTQSWAEETRKADSDWCVYQDNGLRTCIFALNRISDQRAGALESFWVAVPPG